MTPLPFSDAEASPARAFQIPTQPYQEDLLTGTVPLLASMYAGSQQSTIIHDHQERELISRKG